MSRLSHIAFAATILLTPGITCFEYARAKPGALSFGSVVRGSMSYLSVELFKGMTGTQMVSVSYKGTQQATMAVIGGEVHLVCDALSSILPHAKSGRVRALGVTSLKRSNPNAMEQCHA